MLLAAQELEEAEKTLQRGLMVEPMDVEARVMLGLLRMEQERDEEAIASKSLAAQYYLGRALQKQWRPKRPSLHSPVGRR